MKETADNTSEPVQIKLNNNAYTLKLTVNNLCDAEAISGVNLFAFDTMSIAVIRGLLFAAVRGQHSIKTIEQAGELLDLDMDTVLEAVTKAYTNLWGKTAKVK